MNSFDDYRKRFFGGYRLFDAASGFMLNYAGAAGFERDRTIRRDRKRIDAALDFSRRIEAAETVNASEGRRVDHFNLRKGAGLKKSLAQWEAVKAAIGEIREGRAVNEHGARFTDVIVNGIGGSFLGPLMLLIAKHGADYNFGRGLPLRMHFASNTDPEGFDMLVRKLDLSTTIMVNISKSGGTAETAGNMEAFNALLSAKGFQAGRHNITVTTPGSPFDRESIEKDFMHVFHMNTETGGRTSVGSAVGMVPAAFAGIDFAAFLRGQAHMDALTRKPDPAENPAMILALVINDLIRREGHKNQIVLGYSDSLKETAHYFQQLFMESLGKRLSITGRKLKAPTGLTIFGGVGTGEQHAFMQQIQEGISDSFVHFISFRSRAADFPNSKAGSMGRQMLAFVEGTEKALLGNGREFVTLTFERQDEFNMGMLIALEERVVAFLGGMWGINPFDQPGVQAGKLSADNHNRLSKAVVDRVARGGFRGTATEMAAEIGADEADAPGIESILLDIVANHAVAGAYPELEKFRCAAKWHGTGFGFSIRAGM